MSTPEPSFTVQVDVANPGQFFACCGLLELAHRLWEGAEGWFLTEHSLFAILAADFQSAALDRLMSELCRCSISGLSEAEREELSRLEQERSTLQGKGQHLAPEREARLKQLGTEARKGRIALGRPFGLRLDWWQTSEDDPRSPKTWAGRQEPQRMARAAQDALRGVRDLPALLDYTAVLRPPQQYPGTRERGDEAVEPFYFDARRFAHPLDVGFSLDAQDTETAAHPAVELLALIGLQRFRPSPSSMQFSFEYCTWSHPLAAAPASAVAGGMVPGAAERRYRFALYFRHDQRRYKAFGFATLIGGET
jgi:CRISPR-associated protein Csb3